MARMYRVFAFWTGLFALLAYIGHMPSMSLLFFAQTAVFLALSYLNLSEKGYIYIFAGYLVLFFVGFTYYTTFIM
ncbi:DUF2626 family protein [Caldalkalibacillus mannanilyticus]|uniref:DUF2626 family protein n=1 Tax=Caldalkalibacillus mannanilyticus TaxID=1418 RepID=UPI000469B53B|nr:DUF2626 family protein [Caldalkalibacillus mannanilyticus]